MRLLRSVTCLAISVALATPITHVEHEKRNGGDVGQWQRVDRVPADSLIPVRIALKQSNLDKIYERLMEVSHPDSPTYSQHWTQEEIHAHFAPSSDSVDAVRDWLTTAGIASHRILQTANKGFLAVDLTGKEAENLFKTEYYEHEHVYKEDKMAIGCDSYHVPAHVQEHIDYITPGVKMTGVRKRSTTRYQRRTMPAVADFPGRGNPLIQEAPAAVLDALVDMADLSKCAHAVTPACLKKLYNIPEPNNLAHARNQMGIFEDGDFFSQEDLNLFFAKYTTIPNGTAPIVKSVDGAVAPVPVQDAGGESDLDIQLAFPIVYPQKIWVYQVDDTYYATEDYHVDGFGNTFLDAIDGSYCNYTAYGVNGTNSHDPTYPDPHKGGYKGSLMCGVYKPTNVISISYGENEPLLPAAYQKRQCDEFAKLGMQGVSVIIATGDYGVAGFPVSADQPAGQCIGPNKNAFTPPFPNNCPYVTDVGATQIPTNGTVNDREVAAYEAYTYHNHSLIYSSTGGFSNIYDVAPYQASAVDKYFANNEPPFPYYVGGNNIGKNGGVYNRVGRAIPDVSANGLHLAIFLAGKSTTESGTSAACPIFASVINRLNEERLEIGKKPIGFLNPALYSNPSMLNDIVSGTNPGCGTPGFTAVKGWDPVTGLGTPNYPKMLKYFLSLP